MRKYQIFFLSLFLFLSLVACQTEKKEVLPTAETSADPSQMEEIPVTSPSDDRDSPPSGWENGDSSTLPPGFTYDPKEPDKYLYVEEWHG